MGIILYGKPGTGKTSCVQLVINQMIKDYNAICLDFTGRNITFMVDTVQIVRKYSPDLPIIIFIDEFEDVADNPYLLSFLDGIDSVDKCLFIGCTNFIAKIPDRVVNRKGRIKHTFEVKSLPLDVYKEYILEKIPGVEKEIASQFAYRADENELTIDQLKNAVTDYYIDNVLIDDAIKEAKNSINLEGA